MEAKKPLSAAIKKRKLMRALFILSMTIIPAVHFAIFYVYVNLDAFLMAFQIPKRGSLLWSLDNFKWIFKNVFSGSYTSDVDNLALAFVNTFKTFVVKVILFFLGLFISYFIYKKIPGYKAFRVVYNLPGIISGVVIAFFCIEFMGSQSPFVSLLNKVVKEDYVITAPLKDSNYANKMVFFEMIWFGLPGNLIIWGGTYSRIPDSVIESGRLDGANWLVEYFRIILPMVWPTFVLQVVLMLSTIFSMTGNVFLLTNGAYGTQTLSNWMYMYTLQANSVRSPYLYQIAALGLMLSLISVSVALLSRRLMSGKDADVRY